VTGFAPHPRPAYTGDAVRALAAAVRAEHDFPGWLADVLARVAALEGSLSSLTAGRPGSWEAGHVEALADGVLLGDPERVEWFARDERKRRERDGG